MMPLSRRWSRFLAKLHTQLPREAVTLLDYDRHEVRLSVSSAIEYHTRLQACHKEPETIDWIEQMFDAGDVFYDIGANVGMYTLVAAAYWGRAIQCVAVEPSALNFSRLIRNLSLNRFGTQVIPLPVALGEETGLQPFHYANLLAGGALHALGQARDYQDAAFEPVLSYPMLTFDLDTLIARFHLPPPTQIKLDVDGTELAILQGARQTLRKVRSLLVELDDRHPQTAHVRSLLAANGFEEVASYPYRYGALHPEFRGISNVVFRQGAAAHA